MDRKGTKSMLKIGMDDAVIEEVAELVEDYFGDWESAIEAIEDYSDEQKEAGIFDKGKTWLIITLIATLLGITTGEVLANPQQAIHKVKTQINTKITPYTDYDRRIFILTFDPGLDSETKRALGKWYIEYTKRGDMELIREEENTLTYKF